METRRRRCGPNRLHILLPPLLTLLLLLPLASSLSYEQWSTPHGELNTASPEAYAPDSELTKCWTINLTRINGTQDAIGVEPIRAILLRFTLSASFFSPSAQSLAIHAGSSEIGERLAMIHSEDEKLREAFFHTNAVEAEVRTRSLTHLTLLTNLLTIVHHTSSTDPQRHFDLEYDAVQECLGGYQIAPEGRGCIVIPPAYEYDNRIYAGSIAFNLLVLLVELIMIGVVFHFRMSYLFRSASPIFSTLMLLGLMCLPIGGITMTLSPSRGSFVCHARVWSIALGLSVTLSSLIVRADRIRRIFVENQLKKTLLTNKSLLKMVAACTIAQFVLLAIFSGANLSTANTHIVGSTTPAMIVWSSASSSFTPTSYTLSTCTISSGAMGWFSVECIILLSLLAASSWNAWQTRNVPSNFSESFWIGASVYMIGFFTLILVPLQSVLSSDTNPNSSIVVSGFGLGLMSLTLFSLLFASKVYYLLSSQYDVDLMAETTVVVDALTGDVAVVASAALEGGAGSAGVKSQSGHHTRNSSLDQQPHSPTVGGPSASRRTTGTTAATIDFSGNSPVNARRVSVVHGTLQQLVKASGPAAAAIGRARRASLTMSPRAVDKVVGGAVSMASPRGVTSRNHSTGRNEASVGGGERGVSTVVAAIHHQQQQHHPHPLQPVAIHIPVHHARTNSHRSPAIGTAIGSAYRPTERDILNPNIMLHTEAFDPVNDVEFSSRASHSQAAGDHLGVNHHRHSLGGEGSMLLESRRLSVRFDRMMSPSPLPPDGFGSFFSPNSHLGRRATNSPTHTIVGGGVFEKAFERGLAASKIGVEQSSVNKRYSSPHPVESPQASSMQGRQLTQFPDRIPSSPSIAANKSHLGPAGSPTAGSNARGPSPTPFIANRSESPAQNSNLVHPISVRAMQAQSNLVAEQASSTATHHHVPQSSTDSSDSLDPSGDTLSRMAVRARLNHDNRRGARERRGGSVTSSQNLSTVGQEKSEYEEEGTMSGVGHEHATPISTAQSAVGGVLHGLSTVDHHHIHSAAELDLSSNTPNNGLTVEAAEHHLSHIPGCISDNAAPMSRDTPDQPSGKADDSMSREDLLQHDMLSTRDREGSNSTLPHISTPTNLHPISSIRLGAVHHGHHHSHGGGGISSKLNDSTSPIPSSFISGSGGLHVRTQSDSSAVSGPGFSGPLSNFKPQINPLSNTVSPLGSSPHTPTHGPKTRPSLFIARPASPMSSK